MIIHITTHEDYGDNPTKSTVTVSDNLPTPELPCEETLCPGSGTTRITIHGPAHTNFRRVCETHTPQALLDELYPVPA